MKLYKFLILSIGFFLMSFNVHKYYVSLTEVFYNDKVKSVEITTQVFTDDLELTLFNILHKDLNIGSLKEDQKADDFIINYLNQNFIIKINGKISKYKFIGKKVENDLTKIYLEIEGVKNLKSIEISNKIFFETFEEQQHIIKIKTKNHLKNLLLFKDNFSSLINF